MDGSAALRPLDEAAESIRRLVDYDTAAELTAAVLAVADAVETSLRALLRGDAAAPDDHRLGARAPDFPLDAVVQSLRARDRISLQLAGGVHELVAAADHARAAGARPQHGDTAARVVAGLREEITAGAGAPTGTAPTGTAATAGPPPGAASGAEPVPPAGAAGREVSGRWMAYLGAAFAAVLVLGLAWVAMRGDSGDYERAVAAFRAGRLDSAAVAFHERLERVPGDVAARLYLARIHRRQGRPSEAADVLRDAVALAPRDADVRRELGHLFMDLRQPASAVRQYEIAVEQEPDQPLNWTGLIRALRATGDPRAERLLRDAPADVQATLGGTQDDDGG